MHLMEIHKQALRAFKDIDIFLECQYFMGFQRLIIYCKIYQTCTLLMFIGITKL